VLKRGIAKDQDHNGGRSLPRSEERTPFIKSKPGQKNHLFCNPLRVFDPLGRRSAEDYKEGARIILADAKTTAMGGGQTWPRPVIAVRGHLVLGHWGAGPAVDPTYDPAYWRP
jgi:hypothetical protein